ncbi:patatin family protein [Ferrimonas balearica]|uniref:patatin-like phospholipase family protein n=1 Tax=Ferrimonas balearica TaxID=44012 RepID=UPI001C99A384|nr:patatin family protein [Ferrimonas balearica]MBY5992158.1 patatin family protein [Ferrimonas balearica]
MTEHVGPRALIVEGGAMRGIFACGVLDHFLETGFDPFDSFWAVSAGTTNLASFLARMPGRNHKVYLDYSCRPPFVTPGRFALGKHLIDLDWLWEISLRELPIDWDTLQAEQRPYFITLTNSASGEAEYHRPALPLLNETLKASSAMPLAYRGGVTLPSGNYVDGGVADAIPVAEAIRRGAKRILVLRSQSAHYRKTPPRIPALVKAMNRKTPALIPPLLARAQRYNATLELIRNPPEGVEIIELCPPDDFAIGRLTREPKALQRAYEQGLAAGEEAVRAWEALNDAGRSPATPCDQSHREPAA